MVAWKNLFKKPLKIRQLNLNEMVRLYMICKPYVTLPLEPYILADSIYTVSKDKSNKLYKYLYGKNCTFLDDDMSVNIAISLGLVKNNFEIFVSYLGEV